MKTGFEIDVEKLREEAYKFLSLPKKQIKDLGISRATLMRIRNGKAGLEAILNISSATGIHPGKFFKKT